MTAEESVRRRPHGEPASRSDITRMTSAARSWLDGSTSEAIAGGGAMVVTDAAAGATIVHAESPGAAMPTIYHPSLCLILQGAKRTTTGRSSRTLTGGEFVIVSHHLPVVARIVTAERRRPYMAVVLDLDLAIMRSFALRSAATGSRRSAALAAGRAGRSLCDAVSRLLELREADDAAVLGPLVVRELHYLALRAPQGAVLRQLLQRDSHASRVGQATAYLAEHYRGPIVVAELAKSVGMSPASFHAHFRALTKTTPLQYQKELRLIEARSLLQFSDTSVAAAAREVGYESASQFSREYSRRFGHPPTAERQDRR
ncbi:MAG: AraC family transcriptional regulator [bacterium]|nr:AraC family transcriptional regulator [bacterium]